MAIGECDRAASMSKCGGITSYDITLCVGFFQNGDPIDDIMIREYHTINYTCIWRKFCPDTCPRLHVVLQVILARKWLRMQICKTFSGVTPPNAHPVLGHRAVLFPDSRCFGSHNFQIVPARLTIRGPASQCSIIKCVDWVCLSIYSTTFVHRSSLVYAT